MKYTNHHIIPDAGKYSFAEAERLCGFTPADFDHYCRCLAFTLLHVAKIVYSNRQDGNR